MIDKNQVSQMGINIIQISQERNALFEMLKMHFPQTIKEGQVSLNAIKMILGLNESASNASGYELTFTGKGLANALYSTPCQKLLKLQESFTPQTLPNKHPKNAIIVGDNLDALKLLKAAYTEKIKMIYIDPPYNTTNENFIYPDNFRQDYKKILEEVGLIEIDENGQEVESEDLKFFKNIQGSRTHSGWLSFMLPRLKLARDLLKEDGVIFISIDDNEQANLKLLCDEIFGEDYFCGNMIWLKGNAQNDADTIQKNHEYILCYAKNIESNPISKIIQNEKVEVFKDEKTGKFYYEGSGFVSGNANSDLNHHALCGYTIYYNSTTMDLQIFMDYDIEKAKTSNNEKEVYRPFNQNLINQGYNAIRPPKKEKLLGRWVVSFEKFQNLISENKILIKQNRNNFSISRKEWLDAKQVKQDSNGKFYATIEKENPPKSFIDFVSSSLGTKELKKIMNNMVFSNPKNTKLLQYLLQLSTTPNSNDIILDFFAGSGTTAQAVMELNAEDKGNREFILVQIDEEIKEDKSKSAYDFAKLELKSKNPVISDITIERVKRAAQKIILNTQTTTSGNLNLDLGFKVYNLQDKAQITNAKKQITLFNHSNLTPFDKALNLALQSGKTLNKALETIIKDKLYKCEDAYFCVELGEDVLEYLDKTKNEMIFLDGYEDIDLQAFFNLNASFKERLSVVY